MKKRPNDAFVTKVYLYDDNTPKEVLEIMKKSCRLVKIENIKPKILKQ